MKSFLLVLVISALSGSISRAANTFTLTSIAVTNAAGPGALVVTWPMTTGYTYVLKYGTHTGSYTTIVNRAATSPATISNLTPGTSYYMMVTSKSSTGVSRNAVAPLVGIPLARPTNLKITQIGTAAPTLAWVAAAGATAYNVEYGTTSGSYPTLASSSPANPFVLAGLKAGTTYYVTMNSFNAYGSLTASTPATIKVASAATPTPTSTPVATPTATPVATPTSTPIIAPTATPISGFTPPTPQLVVSTTGADTNAGTAAAPFRTIQKAINTATAGTVIGIRGGTYREAVTISQSLRNITLTSYANDAAPVISGADLVSGWKLYSGSIYSVSYNAPVTQIFSDSKLLPTARYPASGYANITANSSSNTQFTSTFFSSLSGSQSAIGANIHMKTNNFTLEDNAITAVSGTTAQLLNKARYTPAQNYGFYLENKLWMMTSPGSWAYDSTAHVLYVWLADSSNPANHAIEASVRTPITVDYTTGTTLSGLVIEKSSALAISAQSATSLSVNYDSLHDLGGNGIRSANSTNVIISNSSLTNIMNDAIYLGGSASPSVIQNTITNNATVGSPRATFSAIGTDETTNAFVSGNTITNAGYNGIEFGIGSRIENNTITNPLLTLMDGGGIYTWQADTSNGAYNAIVSGNRITDAIGNYEGTPFTSVADGHPAVGIYFDQYTEGVTVSNNIIIGCFRGFYTDDSFNFSLTNNIFYQNTDSQIYIDDFIHAGDSHDIVVTGNTFVPSNANAAIEIFSAFNDQKIASFNSNQYLGSAGTVLAKTIYTPTPGNYVNQAFTLSAWQASGMELSGKTISSFNAP